MTKQPQATEPAPQPTPPRSRPPEPVDLVDGIPDRAARAPLWRYLLLAAIALAWGAVLVYCWLAGNPAG